MHVAKLSTDRIVQLLKQAQPVQFDTGLHVLVCNQLTNAPGRFDPYWVPACSVVWLLEFTLPDIM